MVLPNSGQRQEILRLERDRDYWKNTALKQLAAAKRDGVWMGCIATALCGIVLFTIAQVFS